MGGSGQGGRAGLAAVAAGVGAAATSWPVVLGSVDAFDPHVLAWFFTGWLGLIGVLALSGGAGGGASSGGPRGAAPGGPEA